MPKRDASQTALATAYLRAAHQLLDARPLILDDPVALQLLGKGAEQRIRDGLERYQTSESRALRSYVVLRSRFAEDRLSVAIQRGVSQYVIVGAGFDTFGLRQPQWAKALQIIEVDHPGSQVAKRLRIAEAGIQLPTNVGFANIDFEHESLLEGLLRSGITTTKPTLFSWLGVTMYLTETAIDATLQSMTAFPEGSEVVLTFLQPPQATPHAAQSGVTRLAQRAAELGEPFISYFDEAQMKAKLHIAGFSQVEFLTPDIAYSKYFQERKDDLPIPERSGIAAALK